MDIDLLAGNPGHVNLETLADEVNINFSASMYRRMKACTPKISW